MTKIFDFKDFMKHTKNGVCKLNENESFNTGFKVSFEDCLDALYNSNVSEIDRKKNETSFLGDDVDKLVDEIRNFPNNVFFSFYKDCCDDSENIIFFDNNSKEFIKTLKLWCENGNIECQNLLYNTGSWDENDEYAAIVYPKWNGTWVTSFGDDNMPTQNDEFMDYLTYIVIGMNDFDTSLRKFGFNYDIGFADNKRRITSQKGYSESMIDLVYGMYLKYCEHNGLEPEIK